MPEINIPPRIRFALYLVGAIALLVVAYAVDKHWAGDAEVRLVTGLVALTNLLAASRVDLHAGRSGRPTGAANPDTGEPGPDYSPPPMAVDQQQPDAP